MTEPKHDINIYLASDVLSYIMNRFVETYDEYIIKDGFGKYIFVKNMSESNILTSFTWFFDELITSNKFTLGNKKTIMVSGGYPFMNWRTSQFNEIKSKSSRTIIKKQLFLNYVMTDRMIKIDEDFICVMWNKWVFTLMSKPDELAKMINRHDNLFMFCNKRVSEDDLIDVIGMIYGTTRISVMDIDILKSINELNKYVFKDIEQINMPTIVFDECVQFIKMVLNGKLTADE